MYICDDGHDEVVYNTNDCPLCKLMKEIDDLNEKLSDKDDIIESLEDEINDLNRDIEKLQEDKS